MRSIFKKILQTNEAVRKWRASLACSVVATNGCFDVLHAGHVYCLNAARDLGDALVVGINDDRSVRQLKGKGRPVYKLEHRIEILASLECVDAVVVIHGPTATSFLKAVKPTIWAKGSDRTIDELNGAERQAVAKNNGKIIMIACAYGLSTTKTINGITKRNT